MKGTEIDLYRDIQLIYCAFSEAMKYTKDVSKENDLRKVFKTFAHYLFVKEFDPTNFSQEFFDAYHRILVRAQEFELRGFCEFDEEF